MLSHDRSLSNTSDASYFVEEQLDPANTFPSPLDPLFPADSIASIPTTSSAGRGKKVIQEAGDEWDQYGREITADDPAADVTLTAGIPHSFNESERSVRLTKKS
jgi:hypothetical protein